MVCREPAQLADFYEAAFGFRRTDEAVITEPAFAALIGIPGATARVIVMQLCDQTVALIAVAPPGQPYPRAVSGMSSLFQHFAIVVSDMAAAYARLSAVPDWEAISTCGPQLLPASSGGVTAFKFRDPEGHPLELIAFPADAVPIPWLKSSATGCLGIDHSAISIADTERSVKFYEQFGLRRTAGSLNTGPEQDRLDGVTDALVAVTALAPPAGATPHVELLCYRTGFDWAPPPAINDVAATRLVLAIQNGEILDALCRQVPDAILSGPVRFNDGSQRAMLRDPDGHLLCLEAAALIEPNR
jgi:catechol 2,3-dioxygenase-like lactoylglutathione lyase family enzyme